MTTYTSTSDCAYIKGTFATTLIGGIMSLGLFLHVYGDVRGFVRPHTARVGNYRRLFQFFASLSHCNINRNCFHGILAFLLAAAVFLWISYVESQPSFVYGSQVTTFVAGGPGFALLATALELQLIALAALFHMSISYRQALEEASHDEPERQGLIVVPVRQNEFAFVTAD